MSHTLISGTTAFSPTLHDVVNENFRRRAMLNVATQSSAFTVWDDDTDGVPIDVYLVDATGGAVVVELPDPATNDDAADGRSVWVMKVDASGNAVTLDPEGAITINGGATLALSSQWSAALVVSDGTNWVRLS